jgi:hypothetical protein
MAGEKLWAQPFDPESNPLKRETKDDDKFERNISSWRARVLHESNMTIRACIKLTFRHLNEFLDLLSTEYEIPKNCVTVKWKDNQSYCLSTLGNEGILKKLDVLKKAYRDRMIMADDLMIILDDSLYFDREGRVRKVKKVKKVREIDLLEEAYEDQIILEDNFKNFVIMEWSKNEKSTIFTCNSKTARRRLPKLGISVERVIYNNKMINKFRSQLTNQEQKIYKERMRNLLNRIF